MAYQEGTCSIETAFVICIVPDICWTPMGNVQVPVPYIITARFSDSVAVVSSVRLGGKPCFILKSSISRCTGDEPGVGGGIISGTTRSICEPIENGATVSADKAHVVRHGDPFWMNKKNTLGVVVFPESMGPVESDPSEEEGWFDWAWRKADEWKLGTRAWGAVDCVTGTAGAVTAGTGAVLTSPTVAGSVVLGAVALNQADVAQAGCRTVISGEETQTLMESTLGTTGVVLQSALSPQKAAKNAAKNATRTIVRKSSKGFTHSRLRGISRAEYDRRRKEFNSAYKRRLWKGEARRNPQKYSKEQLDAMREGKAPKGIDGKSMEIHHKQPLAQGGQNDVSNLEFLTQTEHRGPGNYGIKHPKL